LCKRRHIKDWIAGCNLRRWMVLKRASALVLWAWKMRDWARESGRSWESNLPWMLLFSSISGGEECGTDVIRRNLPNLSGVVLGRVAVEWIGVCCGCVKARLMEWVEF